jgi:hypothetical protein
MLSRSQSPAPVADFRHVLAVLIDPDNGVVVASHVLLLGASWTTFDTAAGNRMGSLQVSLSLDDHLERSSAGCVPEGPSLLYPDRAFNADIPAVLKQGGLPDDPNRSLRPGKQ